MFTFPRRCERPELRRGRRTGMEPGIQAENGRGVPQTDRQTGGQQTGLQKQVESESDETQKPGPNHDRCREAESQVRDKRKSQKEKWKKTETLLHSSMSPLLPSEKAKVQKEAMDLSQKEHPRPGAPPPWGLSHPCCPLNPGRERC